jgi:outer membrane protein
MNKVTFGFIFFIIFNFNANSQSKKWTLEECINYALKNNISIKQTELNLTNANVDKKAAFGNFLPNLNASASHSWNIGLNQNITTGLLENQTTQFTAAGLSSNITIYNGLKNQLQFQRSKMAIVAAQYQIDKMKEDISLNIANAYLQILFNKENKKVQQEQLANNEKQLIRTTELVDAGVVARGDLLDVKATVAADKQRLVAAENTLFISKLNLAQLLQLDDFKDFDIVETNYDTIESTTLLQKPEDIVAKAKEIRVEMKIAKSDIELAEKDIKISRSSFQPSLNGFYNFSTRAAYFDRVTGFVPNTANPNTVIGQVEGTGQNVIQPNFIPVLGNPNSVFEQFSDNKGHSFGVQLSVPIFNGFATRNNVERSKINLEQKKLSQAQAELDLERNVYNAITDAKGALNSYQSALTAVEARQEAFNYAKEKYAVGMMNSFDFNQAQTLLINAQSDVLRTKYDYIFKVKLVEIYFGIPLK